MLMDDPSLHWFLAPMPHTEYRIDFYSSVLNPPVEFAEAYKYAGAGVAALLVLWPLVSLRDCAVRALTPKHWEAYACIAWGLYGSPTSRTHFGLQSFLLCHDGRSYAFALVSRTENKFFLVSSSHICTASHGALMHLLNPMHSYLWQDSHLSRNNMRPALHLFLSKLSQRDLLASVCKGNCFAHKILACSWEHMCHAPKTRGDRRCLALRSNIITICTHMCTPIYDACFDLIILFSSVLHLHAIMPQCYMHAFSHQSRIMFSNLSVIRSCLYITIVSYCIVRTATHFFTNFNKLCISVL